MTSKKASDIAVRAVNDIPWFIGTGAKFDAEPNRSKSFTSENGFHMTDNMIGWVSGYYEGYYDALMRKK